MTTQQTPVINKQPWLAVILSTIWPGVGQIYAGRVIRGFIFIFITLSLIGVGSWLFLSSTGNIGFAGQFLVGYLVFSIFNLFDAHHCTRKSNEVVFEVARRGEKDPWLAVFLNRFIPGLGHAYQGNWISAFLFFILIVGSYLAAVKSPWFELVAFGLSYFSLYHVYIFAPTQSEKSKSLIVTICLTLLSVQLVGILLALSVRIFIAEPRYIPSSSMEPSLLINDRLIIDKLSFHWRKPVRGEIIMFNPPNHPIVPDSTKAYINRVIGLPGDRISIRDGKVFINDAPLNEPYIAASIYYTLPTKDDSLCPRCFIPDNVQTDKNGLFFTVPNRNYWVMGDNRNNSLDSHVYGFMPEKNLIGRAMLRYYPLDDRAGHLTVPKY